MVRSSLVLVSLAALVCCAAPANAERTLTGTWCLEEEELQITFTGKDSVKVRSTAEDGVNGSGSFRKQDTMFVATIAADSLEVKMGYRYTWKTDSLIQARTLFMTINGDSVNVPGTDVMMKRCKAAAAPAKAPASTTGSNNKKPAR